MIELHGQVVLVTAGSRGVGRAIALRLAEAGADLVVNFAHARPDADATAGRIADLGRRVAEVQADLTEPDDLATMLDWIGTTFGRLDVVVCNVPAGPATPLLATTPADFDVAMQRGVRPLILLAQHATDLLARSPGGGQIVAVGRATGTKGLNPTQSAALSRTVEHLAEELAPRGVRVNALLGGEAAPETIADMVLLLASPLSRGLRGQTLQVGPALSPVSPS
jgi:enoyl-[acyl-carrier protein] reductase III